MKKTIILIIGTLVFVFMTYFKRSLEYLISVKDCFYKDYMFYVALLIAFLCSFIFTRFIKFENK